MVHTPHMCTQSNGKHHECSRLVHVVLHEEGLLDGRLGAWLVLALGGLGVGNSTGAELVLRGLVVLLLAAPDLDAGRLQRTGVREGKGEGALALELVDLVEVDGGVLLGDTTREESADEMGAQKVWARAKQGRSDQGGRVGGLT